MPEDTMASGSALTAWLTGYRIMVRHLVELIGNVKLAELKVRDVGFARGKLAKRLSTRSVRLARMIGIQAIRNAMVNDLVVRNVADLAAVPTGKPGRPSRSLNLEQALAVLDTAKEERLWPYVAVSMLGGIRTGETRALRWSEVDLGCDQTPAPPGFANRRHCAGPAVRQQRNGRRRPNLTR
jgi:integrase